MQAAGRVRGDRLRVWYMTTGEAGSRQQARGLARELSDDAEERLVAVNRLWAMLPSGILGRSQLGVSCVEGRLEPPWPDVLITCGRRSALASMAIRRRCPSPMVAVHIQPPDRPEAFDLVVAMTHDRLAAPNVIRIETALHGVRGKALAEAAGLGDARFAGLPRPWTGVLLGGSTGRSPFRIEDGLRLIDQMEAHRAGLGGSLLITPSRRTPPEVVDLVAKRYAADNTAFVWDARPPNPYVPILAMADQLVVTGDSISMISEGLATLAPISIFEVDGGRRHTRFLNGLLDQELVGLLGESRPPARSRGIDATPMVATLVRQLIAERLGVVSGSSEHPGWE